MACELSLCLRLTGAGAAGETAAQDRCARWAIDALQQAVAAGYRDIAHMRVDTDLDPLRGREGFRLMMMDLAFPSNPLATVR